MIENNNKFSLRGFILILMIVFLVASVATPRGAFSRSPVPQYATSSHYEELSRQLDFRDEGTQALLTQFADTGNY